MAIVSASSFAVVLVVSTIAHRIEMAFEGGDLLSDPTAIYGCWRTDDGLQECFGEHGQYNISQGYERDTGTWRIVDTRALEISMHGSQRWDVAEIDDRTLVLTRGLQEIRYNRAADESTSRVDLGGGYQDAKWGMSSDQVRDLLPGLANRQSSEFLIMSQEDGAEIKCWFDDQGLSRVEVHPSASTVRDTEGIVAMLRAMESRFGEGMEVPNRVDATLGIPLRVFQWSDAETTITFQMWDPERAEAHGIPVDSLAGTITLIYESTAATRRAAAAEQRAREQTIENRTRAIEGQL